MVRWRLVQKWRWEHSRDLIWESFWRKILRIFQLFLSTVKSWFSCVQENPNKQMCGHLKNEAEIPWIPWTVKKHLHRHFCYFWLWPPFTIEFQSIIFKLLYSHEKTQWVYCPPTEIIIIIDLSFRTWKTNTIMQISSYVEILSWKLHYVKWSWP